MARRRCCCGSDVDVDDAPVVFLAPGGDDGVRKDSAEGTLSLSYELKTNYTVR